MGWRARAGACRRCCRRRERPRRRRSARPMRSSRGGRLRRCEPAAGRRAWLAAWHFSASGPKAAIRHAGGGATLALLVPGAASGWHGVAHLGQKLAGDGSLVPGMLRAADSERDFVALADEKHTVAGL